MYRLKLYKTYGFINNKIASAIRNFLFSEGKIIFKNFLPLPREDNVFHYFLISFKNSSVLNSYDVWCFIYSSHEE